MSTLTFQQVLDLVGPLDDSPGENTARDRFRKYLEEAVHSFESVRECIGICLTGSGMQYCRALQDLVNHAARLIGFEVEYGRYQGVAGQIGFDGVWRHEDLAIVVEVKTSDVYAINTATLIGYVDHLISEQRIADWDHALGLYIVGRHEAGLTQLENAITGQKRAHQLRVATVDSLLAVGKLVQERRISTEEALALVRPAGVRVDDIVCLLERVASRPVVGTELAGASTVIREVAEPSRASKRIDTAADRMHVLTPVSDDKEGTAKETIRNLLESGWYVFGDRTPGRKRLKPGDRICFYESGVGVVASAEVGSVPERKVLPNVRHPEKYAWAFQVEQVRFFFDQPVVLDRALRARLDAFEGRDPAGSWAWFVQSTHELTEQDFELLTAENKVTG